MSAFFVPAATIDDVVRLLEVEDSMYHTSFGRNQLGQRLWSMNADAVIFRYGLNNTAEGAAMRTAAANYNFQFTRAGRYQQVKSAACLLYQCSEGDIPQSDMFRSVSKIVDPLWDKMADHKRMHPAEWGREGEQGDPRNMRLKAEPIECS